MTPSVWPAVLSAGLTLAMLGVVTNVAFTAVGLLLTAGSLVGWVADLRHDRGTH
ncbi:MAG TPA: hypothetical protein VFA49_16030 [Chloroflexota bacterium]|jgi:hypothetical protein|nr:hypothetical protein [Chloroflexota bacterium]